MQFVWIALFAVVLTAVIVIIVRYSKREDEKVQLVWKAFAREQGLRWKDGTGSWFPRYEAHGESSGVPVRLLKYVVSTGKSTITYTRFIGQLRPSVEHKIVVGRRSFGTTLGEMLGYRPISTGDAAFDTRMVLRSRSRDAALAIIGPATRERILAFPKKLWIECKGGEAKVWWHGAEMDPKVLASGLAVVTALCGADAGSPSRPISR